MMGITSLKKIHPITSLKPSSLNFWRKKSTQEIVDSLKLGRKDALKVKPDGSVMDGNTRIQILEERGYDVNSLPREMYKSQDFAPWEK